jgi:hypothetical protein
MAISLYLGYVMPVCYSIMLESHLSVQKKNWQAL